MSTSVRSCVATARELEVMAALRRLGPAFDPDPGTRDAAKHRLMLVLSATPVEARDTLHVPIAGQPGFVPRIPRSCSDARMGRPSRTNGAAARRQASRKASSPAVCTDSYPGPVAARPRA